MTQPQPSAQLNQTYFRETSPHILHRTLLGAVIHEEGFEVSKHLPPQGVRQVPRQVPGRSIAFQWGMVTLILGIRYSRSGADLTELQLRNNTNLPGNSLQTRNLQQ